MKTKIAAAFFAVAAMLTTACEQHKWSDTSQLFKSHGDHGHAGGEGHGDAHGKADEHGKAGAHGEKTVEAAHGEPAKH